ncbi:MAG: putative transport system ATP-binding protein [Solirubrobacterales bacterium]|nr:putative transport system ATP-binding protein [Solirubrobacterales bacterium]
MELTGTRRNGSTQSLYVEPERDASEIDWPALELIDVFKIFRSGPVETVALRGLDLRVEKGEMVAVIGPSGSGKSTLVSLAGGLDVPSAGEVRAFGRPLATLSETERAAYRARDVAIVFQADNLWSGLSARENVSTILRLGDAERDGDPVGEALATFGLAARSGQRPGQLSGGEQQRVAIAAAAARRAPLVLADEPTGELDRRNERIVLDSLRELRDVFESTVIVVTHSDRVASSCDRVVVVRDGRAES